MKKSLVEAQLGLALLGFTASLIANASTFAKVNIDGVPLKWAVSGLLIWLFLTVPYAIGSRETRKQTPSKDHLLQSCPRVAKVTLAMLLLYSVVTWGTMLHATNGALARRDNGNPVLTLRYGRKVGAISEAQYELYRTYEVRSFTSLFSCLFLIVSLRLSSNIRTAQERKTSLVGLDPN